MKIPVFILASVLIFTMMFCSNKNVSHDVKRTAGSGDSSTIQLHKSRFEEHFDSSFSAAWTVQSYSFPGNGCEMSTSQVNVHHSLLTLSVDLNKKDSNKPFKGGEISTVFPFLYGRFAVRMKNQIAPGTVSSFFLMNKWEPENWEHKEIDIEFLGKNTKVVQFTIHHFKNGGRKHVNYIYTYSLGFDSSRDFHEYAIDWNKDSVSWYVDGHWVHTEKRIIIREGMYIRLNHWAASPENRDAVNWLGTVDTLKLPSRVYYDQINYTPLNN